MQIFKNTIAIVDDDEDILLSAELFLKSYFEQILCFTSPKELLSRLEELPIDLVVLDLNYSKVESDGKQGILALNTIKKAAPKVEVLVMTAYAEISTAVEAVHAGAFDFIVKPWQNDKLLITIINALQNRSLQNELLNNEVKQYSLSADLLPIIGESDKIMAVRNQILKLANTSAIVHLEGEVGVGKSLIAKHIHVVSERKSNAFIEVDFAQVEPNLQVDYLFSEHSNSSSKWELAQGGTLFLNNIQSMSTGCWQRLLQNFGSTQKNNTTIISASKTGVKTEFTWGSNETIPLIILKIPPLKERQEDVPELLNYYLDYFSTKYNKRKPVYNSSLIDALRGYAWPLNVKELVNKVEQTVLLEYEAIEAEDLIQKKKYMTPTSANLNLENVEKQHILLVLTKNDWNIQQTAKDLGISRASLYRRIEKYNLNNEVL